MVNWRDIHGLAVHADVDPELSGSYRRPNFKTPTVSPSPAPAPKSQRAAPRAYQSVPVTSTGLTPSRSGPAVIV